MPKNILPDILFCLAFFSFCLVIFFGPILVLNWWWHREINKISEGLDQIEAIINAEREK